MNRAERRRIQRSAQGFDSRQTFSKKELETMNAHAFKIGTAMALYAAKNALGLGDTRLDRVRLELRKLELKYVEQDNLEPLPFVVDRMNKLSTERVGPYEVDVQTPTNR